MNEPRFIGADAVAESLSFENLIEPMEAAFAATSEGRAGNGVVMIYPGSDRAAGDTMVKTATLAGHPFQVVKIAPCFAANVTAGRPQGGLIVVLDSVTGHTLAVIEDRHRLSDLRTAAAGAIAARHLAPRDAARAAVLGAGVQAYWQARALHSERPFDTLAIWARDAAKAGNSSRRGPNAEFPLALTHPNTAVYLPLYGAGWCATHRVRIVCTVGPPQVCRPHGDS